MDDSSKLGGFADTLATLDPDETIVPPTIANELGTADERTYADFINLASDNSLQIGSVIGEGGMGVVHEAEQISLGRPVAVKTLRMKRRDHAAALSLFREAWITGMLEHPNIVPVHYLELDADSLPVIAMKRVEGVGWNGMIRDANAVRRRFGASDLLAWNVSILIQVLNALRFAHSRGVIHRDLKPSNVMIGEFGEVYLLDWGIAVSLRSDAHGRLPVPDPSHLAGTPSYMAPEMLSPDGPGVSTRTDIYVAGAVLFEIIAGHPPHAGQTALEVLSNLAESRPKLPSGAPPELAKICQRAMHMEPEKRFDSVEDLQLALRRYLEHRGSAVIASSAWERFAQLQTAIKAATNGEEIHRLFGACRFGFHEALAAWPDNADAKAGLTAATIAVAQYELQSNPHAAVTLLADIDAGPELAAARQAAAEHTARQKELEQVGAHHDPIVGARMRLLLGGVLGIIYTMTPILAWRGVIPPFLEHRDQLTASLLLLVVSVLLWLVRDRYFRTAINRRLLYTCILLFGSQSLLVAGTWLAGLPSELDPLLIMFHAAVMAWVVTIAIDPWLTPAAICYSVAFPIVAAGLVDRNAMIAFTNITLTANVVWLWWPTTRAALSRRS
ncbi:MAG TPA: serine/threonine-protein kinase [Kofleriaceae bacterium]|nr:serine/threonine-protein kinase [Kofleriaceae bacterium]